MAKYKKLGSVTLFDTQNTRDLALRKGEDSQWLLIVVP